MGKQWKYKEDKFLISMRNAGRSYKEIAEPLERTPASCQQRAFKMGIVKPHRKEQPAQEQDKQETTGEVRKVTLTRTQINICNTLGLTPRQYAERVVMLEEEHAARQQRRKQMPKRKNTKWTKELDQQLVSLRELGVKPREIASIMGISRTAIYNRSAALGVTRTSAQLEMDLQVAPVTKTEFRESPKTQPKPTWWSAMMWWRK